MQELFGIPVVWAGVISDAPGIAEILLRILQFLLSIAGIVGIIGLVIAGILYLTAAGDEGQIDKAKKTTLASVTGLVVVLGALVVVSQLVEFFS